VRDATIAASSRLQESVAVSGDRTRWVLLNASPDVARQIEAFPALHPTVTRSTPIAAIVLTNGDLDHCLGLLMLREAQPLVVYATEAVRDSFVENPFARTLQRFSGQLDWRVLSLGAEVPLAETSLLLTALPAPGKPPLHREGRVAAQAADNVGLRIRDAAGGALLAYFPGVGRLTETVRAALEGVACVFFDGTFWSSDELRALGVAARPAEGMGHLPIGGPTGSLAGLADVGAGRRVYIHLNNTNPVLRDDSPERAAVSAAGWEVARDGAELDVP
jgi:pyrroloquinoline quinone biosynthesis protein B